MYLYSLIVICDMEQGSTCIVNAASDRDMAVFAAGMIKANSLPYLYHVIV